MTEQPLTTGLVDELSPPPVQAVLRAYAGVYERRRLANSRGEIFRNSEANAIAALSLVEISAAGASALSPRDVVATITSLTRRTLTREPHTIATDAAGLSWARAWGVLAIRHPPLEQAEYVLRSGNVSGAVAGLYGSAWRALFLADAMHLFNWRYRPMAGRQLPRWLEYMTPKAVALSDERAEPLAPSQAARIAFVLAGVAARTGDDTLHQAAERIAATALAHQHADGSIDGEQPDTATAVAAQVTAAATAVGDSRGAGRGRDYLLGSRLDVQRKLLWAIPAEGRFEISPWIPLALLGIQRLSS